MPVLVVLVASGSCLLVLAGLNKIRHPEGTAPALTQLTRWGHARALARAIGIIELAIGLWFLIFPSDLSSLSTGVWYLVLMVSASILRLRKTDCGCFGADSTEVTLSHLVITGLVAACALSVWVAVAEISRLEGLYWLLAGSIPIALGWYGLMVPMAALRSSLRELHA